MPRIYINNFNGGMDLRNIPTNADAGTLRKLQNGQINRGGEIEKPKSFVRVGDMPSETRGLYASAGQVYTFGTAESVAFDAALPSNLNYKQLPVDDNVTLSAVLSADFFTGNVYVIGRFSDGSIRHFYEGNNGMEQVDDWCFEYARQTFRITDVGGVVTAATSAVATIEIEGDFDSVVTDVENTYIQNGNTITITATATGAAVNGEAVRVVANNVPYTYTEYLYLVQGGTRDDGGVSETIWARSADAARARFSLGNARVERVLNSRERQGRRTESFSGEFSGGTDKSISGEITQIAVDGVNLLTEPLTFNEVVVPDAEFTITPVMIAHNIVDAINNNITSPNYIASDIIQEHIPNQDGEDGLFVISSQTVGVGDNNKEVVITAENITFSATTKRLEGGGSGSGSSGGCDAASYIRFEGAKGYALSGPLLHFSALNDPTTWEDPPADADGNVAENGSGFINLSTNARGSETLKAIANYFGRYAIFGRGAIQIYHLPENKNDISRVQSIINTGAISGRSVIEYGNNNIIYLDEKGILSLAAGRVMESQQGNDDITNPAFVSDVGEPIDDYVVRKINENVSAAESSVGFYEPRDGRYMLAMGNEIFMFSYFSGHRIAAWSILADTGADYFVWDDRRVMIRRGDALLIQGGSGGDDYSIQVEAELPFLSDGDSASKKQWNGIDVACEGEWEVLYGIDPSNPDNKAVAARVSNTTFQEKTIPIKGYSAQIQLTLRSVGDGPARLGRVVVSYDGEES